MKLRRLFPSLLMNAVLFAIAGQGARAGTETAPYQQVRAASPFEVRDYPALTVVEASVDPATGDGGFGRLFRFISGRNASGAKIAMTTPVLMGAPAGHATMAFVMPAAWTPDQVPRPQDNTLAVREVPPGRFAVLRFSGGRSARNERAALARLKAWLAAENLTASAPPVYDYFDPPWVPTFIRRNEVMLRLDSPP